MNGTFTFVLDQLNNIDQGEATTPGKKDRSEDKYIGSLLRQMVDDVCLYEARLNESKLQSEKDQNEENKIDFENIPLRAVPQHF